MRRCACLLTALFLVSAGVTAWGQDKTPSLAKKIPDGVYAVERESLNEKEVLPLKDGEVLVVQRRKYLKKDDKEPPLFLVVRAAPDVNLDLAAAPKAVKEGEEVLRIQLKLKPTAATALEKLTTDRLGKQVAIVLGGEVVTMHKIRAVVKGGDVEITSCAAGAANYLLEQLQAHHKVK